MMRSERKARQSNLTREHVKTRGAEQRSDARDSSAASSHPILQMHKTVGNRAVLQLIKERAGQPQGGSQGQVVQRTRDEAVKAGMHYDRKSIVECIRDTNINDHYRLTLLLINNHNLSSSDGDYIGIDAVEFPNLTSEQIEQAQSEDITQDYYYKQRVANDSSSKLDSSSKDDIDEELIIDHEEDSHIPEISAKDFEILQIFDSGSTKPQKVKMSNGDIKVIKYGKDEGHLQTEVLSNKLYGKAGIPSLEVDIIRIDGKLAQITDFIEDFQEPTIEELTSSDDFIRHIGADMLFANWDLFKPANWMKIDGRMVRSDNGGALDRKAQGGLKDKKDWNESEVNDFVSMKEKSNSPYNNVTIEEIADSIRTLAFQLTPEKIDEAMEEAHYPLKLRENMKKTILSRIQIGLDYANMIYPLSSTVDIDKKKTESWKKSMVEPVYDADPEDVLEQMRKEGWQNVPDVYDPDVLNYLLMEGIMTPPEEGGKTGNPNESIPMVGPEELLREDQFGGGLNKEMPKYFARMKTGRLVRRMSDKEKEAFEKAAVSEDMMAIVDLIFPGKGKPGERGEMVWSVNDPYIFDREKSELRGEEYTGKESKHNPENYHWIMEIYITDDMLEFIQNYSYINNPTGGSKPSAFMGNPTLKKEGNSGGRGDEEGVPNVVIKKDGFSKFWSTVRKFQFVKADVHLWKNRSNNEEMKRIRIEKERKERQEEIKKQRELKREKEKNETNDDDFGFSLFGEDNEND